MIVKLNYVNPINNQDCELSINILEIDYFKFKRIEDFNNDTDLCKILDIEHIVNKHNKRFLSDYIVEWVIIPNGEASKNINTYVMVCEELLKKDIRRKESKFCCYRS